MNNRTKIAVIFGAVLCMVHVSGCLIQVGGKQRPLVHVETIKGSAEYTLDQQSDSRKSSGASYQSDSRLMTEQLNLEMKGDVFDPRLMSYAVLGGIGLSQQRYSTDTQSANVSGDLLEYGFNANFLPTKPYPFSIEATRSDQLVPRAFQSPLQVEDSHEGFHLNLRVPEWPMSISWSQSELRQDSDVGFDFTETAFDRKTDRFSYTLSHDFTDYSRLTFRSDIDQVTQTSGVFDSDVKTQRHRLLHYLNFGAEKQHRLDTSLSLVDRQDQFDNTTFDWSENLYLKHSDDFSTFYNTIFSQSTLQEVDTQTITGLAGFTHQLYLNLSTSADVYASRSKFGSLNETATQGGDINFNYRRNNPFGVFLAQMDFNYETAETSGETGTVSVIDESHIFNDPFPFTLNERNIDTTSIVITDASGLFVYTEGDDYTITEIGDEVEITATPLGTEFPNIVDGQTLLVDYLFEMVGDHTEDTTGRRIRLEQRFNNGLSVYLSHRLLERQIDSDIDPDLLGQDTETLIYGAEYQFKRITFIAEHMDTDSSFQSTKSNRLAARSYWPLTPATSLTSTVSQTWIDTSGDNSRQSTLFRADGRLRTRLNKYVSLSGRTEFRQEDNSDIGHTNGYRVGASLDYNRGSLSVRTGWDTYFLERRNSESDSTRFYLNLVRRF